MKIALAHDSLVQYGGAERVLEALHELYPDAPVFTLAMDPAMKERFSDWHIIASPLQYIYNVIPKLQYLLPLVPLALKFFDFSEFDLVISSSSIFMKGITVPKTTVHINYCHTPARFLWDINKTYIAEEVPWYLKPLLPLLIFTLHIMREWDLEASKRVDYFIANSKNIQKRIAQIYHRDSVVIYPFVDTDFYYPTIEKKGYLLAGGRLQKHKRIDLAIAAAKKLTIPIHIIGSGRAEQELRDSASPTVVFSGKVSDIELRDAYSGALLFLQPQEEDFGMMVLESFACGTPVVAYDRGGAIETVIPEKTGILFEEQTVDSLAVVIQTAMQKQFLQEDLYEQANAFSKELFMKTIEKYVYETYAQWKGESDADRR